MLPFENGSPWQMVHCNVKIELMLFVFLLLKRIHCSCCWECVMHLSLNIVQCAQDLPCQKGVGLLAFLGIFCIWNPPPICSRPLPVAKARRDHTKICHIRRIRFGCRLPFQMRLSKMVAYFPSWLNKGWIVKASTNRPHDFLTPNTAMPSPKRRSGMPCSWNPPCC